MTKKDIQAKISHLENIFEKVEALELSGCDNITIERLEKLLRDEYVKEYHQENPHRIYLGNISQTIDKQLEPLLRNQNKPRIRGGYYYETTYHFRADIKQELGRLKSML